MDRPEPAPHPPPPGGRSASYPVIARQIQLGHRGGERGSQHAARGWAHASALQRQGRDRRVLQGSEEGLALVDELVRLAASLTYAKDAVAVQNQFGQLGQLWSELHELVRPEVTRAQIEGPTLGHGFTPAHGHRYLPDLAPAPWGKRVNDEQTG